MRRSHIHNCAIRPTPVGGGTEVDSREHRPQNTNLACNYKVNELVDYARISISVTNHTTVQHITSKLLNARYNKWSK